jgi:hypothetical protein
VHKLSTINDSVAVTFVEAVIHHDLVAVSQQLFGDYTAYITGATGYQHFHDSLIAPRFLRQAAAA